MKQKKKYLMIDLDETLISAIDTDEIDDRYHDKASKFAYKPYEMDDCYVVFPRPDLDEFLDYIFENFRVSVFTAASKDYALFIIDKIILGDHNHRKLDHIFFSYHCDISKKLKKGIKDLTILWDVFNLPGYNKYNTIIIDDNDGVKKTGFCIQVKEFNAMDDDSENDKYLLHDLKHRLEKYRQLPDDVQFVA